MSRSQGPRPGDSRAIRRSVRAGALLLTAVWFVSAIQIQAGSADAMTVNSAKLTVYRSCVLSGTIAASTSMIESYVDQANATTNFGGATTMLVASKSSTTLNQRSYVTFDLSKCSPAIPSTATVTNATLRLWVTAIATACRTEDIFPVTAAWTETAIKWNNQPFGTTLNNPASGTRTDGVNVGAAVCTYSAAAQYVSWNVTADVVKFVAGTMTNNGWMIRDDVESASATARTNTYSTSDLASVPQAPQLVVNYAT